MAGSYNFECLSDIIRRLCRVGCRLIDVFLKLVSNTAVRFLNPWTECFLTHRFLHRSLLGTALCFLTSWSFLPTTSPLPRGRRHDHSCPLSLLPLAPEPPRPSPPQILFPVLFILFAPFPSPASALPTPLCVMPQHGPLSGPASSSRLPPSPRMSSSSRSASGKSSSS
jgi:hypothetical protein